MKEQAFQMDGFQNLEFGFSSKMVLLMWCVWGGFLLHILECNYLTVLVKPVYEKPIDTAEDIIERGITIIDQPGRESMVQMLKRSPYPLTRALAENTYVTKVVIFLVANSHSSNSSNWSLSWSDCWLVYPQL